MSSVVKNCKPVEVKDLSFTYRGESERAIEEINFSQQPGEFVAIMGPTGAGKSTFCRCLNGLIPNLLKGELEGEVWISGERITGRRVQQLAQRVGLVFQDFESQLFSTNVELEVAFGPENFCVPHQKIKERIADSIATVGLKGFQTRDPSTLSGGEKQRLAIASVLAIEPQILVMDEPTTDLDPVGKKEIFALAKRLRGKINSIIVEHETEQLLSADRVVIINQGRKVAEGRPAEIFNDSGLLEANGIRPLQIGMLFDRLKINKGVSSWQEAWEVLRGNKWSLGKEELQALKEKDRQKQRYGEVIIDIENLSYSYDARIWALNDVSLKIKRGEMVAVIGQNGCGKTTLVKHLNGLLSPTRGRVKLFGRDTREWKVSQLGRRVGYVFQNPDQQIFADTVWEEVCFGPRNFGSPEQEIKAKVKEALERVGLEGYEQKDPFSLTKGERQKVAIASILASEPEVIILDEPTTGLDYHGQRSVLGLLEELNNRGHTIIIVTHSMWMVAEHAHRCIIMKEGRIISDRSVREVFADEKTLASASLDAPEIVKLSNQLVPGLSPGSVQRGTALSVDELCSCLRR